MSAKITKIGVASSVAKSSGFDNFVGFAYALEHNFELYQAYLTIEQLHDVVMLKKLVTLGAKHELQLIYHAPFDWDDPKFSVDNWSALAKCKTPHPKIVISHYSGAGSEEQLHSSIQGIGGLGLLPSIEVCFDICGVTAEQCLSSVKKALVRYAGSLPVSLTIDPPRFFAKGLRFATTPRQALDAMLRFCVDLKIPVLWHLIDFVGDPADRARWQPIGQGDLHISLESLLKSYPNLINIGVVFEYEDYVNPLLSRKFLFTNVKK